MSFSSWFPAPWKSGSASTVAAINGSTSFSPGMGIGEMAFLDGSPCSTDYVAMVRVGYRVIRRTFFDKMGTQSLALKAKLLHEIVI